MMDAPAILAASPAAASPASRGMSRPIAPASSAVPTRYRSHCPAAIWSNVSTAVCSPASLGMQAKAKNAASRICAVHSRVFLRLRVWAARAVVWVTVFMDISIRALVVGRRPAALDSGAGTELASLQRGEELCEALVGVADAAFHAGGDYCVAVCHRLEGRDRADQRAAVALLQRGGVELDVAGRALELEGLHNGIRRGGAVEDAVEAVLVALGVGVDVAPPAAVAGV